MSKDRLRAEYLPMNVACSYVRVIVDGCLAGNAFACRWPYQNKSVCWITQLVVHHDYRERGLAVGLLNELRQEQDDIYGVIGSHVASCLATAKAFGSKRILRICSMNLALTICRYLRRTPTWIYQRSCRSNHESVPNKLRQER